MVCAQHAQLISNSFQVCSLAPLNNSTRMQRMRNKRAGNLDPDVYSIIIGSLLGNAHAERRINTAKSKNPGRISSRVTCAERWYSLFLYNTRRRVPCPLDRERGNQRI